MSISTGPDRSLGEKYRLVRTLKSGHGVRTLLAVDLEDDNEVVIKVVEPHMLSTEACVRLEHEAAVLRSLDSPWLAPLLEVVYDSHRLYFVMPCVPGVTLEERLGRGGPLPVSETLALARCLLGALAEIHDHGVVHCDVKPSNVMVDGGPPLERATLIDFGYARSSSLVATFREQWAGSVQYMAPEQAGLIAHEVDERADLYSLGILIFECLAGEPPFQADDLGELFRQHLSAPAPLLRGRGVMVPRSLDEIVQRLLQKDPDDRYHSARAVLADLADLAAAMDLGIDDPQIVVGAHDRRQTLTEPPLTAREDELALLSQHLEQARYGEGGVVAVDGKSGGGKTRLLDEFCRQAAGEGVWVLRGQGVDRVATRPLQVLAGVAAGVVATTKSEPQLAADLRERLGDHAVPLCHVLPELGEVLDVPSSQWVAQESFSQAWGVEGLIALLDALGSPERPALVVLDDCQWIDDMSVRVLLGWVRRDRPPDRSGPNVLVVVAARSEEITETHPLRGLTDVTRVELPPLSETQIRQVVESMAGHIPPPALDLVVALSGGSPFMVLAVLRGLVESDALSPAEDGWHFEPSSVAGVQASRKAAAFLARRLELLAPSSRRLLTAGAVLGRDFELGLAAVLAGQGENEAGSAVTQALQRHLVWRGEGGRFVFVHDRLRDTFLENLEPSELAELHLRAAEGIELAEPSQTFELSYHFDAGGQPDRALPYAVSSAEVARSRNDLELAEGHYRIAERGTVHAPAATRRQVAVGLGQVLMLRGRYDEARRRLETALSLAEDEVTSARIQGELGELAFKRDDIDDAARWIEQALRMLDEWVPRRYAFLPILVVWELMVRVTHRFVPARWPRTDKAGDDRRLLAAHLYTRLVYAWYFSRRGARGAAWVVLRQVNRAELCPPSPELAHAYGIYAGWMGSTCPVLWRRALRYADHSKALHEQLGNIWGEGHALCMRALVLCAAGRFSEGEQDASEAMRFLKRSGDPWELYWAALHKTLCLYRMGHLRGAIEQARSTHQSAVALGDPQAEATTLEIWAKATDGHLPAEPIEVALQKAGVDIQRATALLQAQALHLRAIGRRGEALRSVEEAVNLTRQARAMNMYLVPALPLLATFYREELEEALLPRERRRLLRRSRRAVRRARRFATLHRNELPHALREAAMVAALSGRNRRARRLFKASLHRAEERQAYGEIAETLRLRARIGGLLDWPELTDDLVRGAQILQRINPDALAAQRAATLGLAERFDSLLAAGGPLVLADSSDDIAVAIEEAVMLLLRPEQCCVVGIGPRSDVGLDEAGIPGSMAGQALVQRATEERRPVVFSEPRPGGTSSDSIVLAGLRSAICAPVIVSDEVVGCFLASHSRVATLFGDEEQRLAMFIAHLAGAALERERLRQNTRARVVAAQEAERARIARDLHDEIGQALTSVLLTTNQIRTSLDAETLDRKRLLDRTEEVVAVATDTLDQVQRLAFEMRPTVLDDLGLVAAVRRLVGHLSARHEITVNVAISQVAPGDRFPADVETTAYRVAQEALSNVLRHAQVPECSVVLARVQNYLRLVVADNGAGFDPARTPDRLGLRGMAERAALVGGSVRIDSAPGEGTVVVMELPIG